MMGDLGNLHPTDSLPPALCKRKSVRGMLKPQKARINFSESLSTP
jgi:hypothetical protein